MINRKWSVLHLVPQNLVTVTKTVCSNHAPTLIHRKIEVPPITTKKHVTLPKSYNFMPVKVYRMIWEEREYCRTILKRMAKPYRC